MERKKRLKDKKGYYSPVVTPDSILDENGNSFAKEVTDKLDTLSTSLIDIDAVTTAAKQAIKDANEVADRAKTAAEEAEQVNEHVTSLALNLGDMNKRMSDNKSNSFDFADKLGFVIFEIGKDGSKAKAYIVTDENGEAKGVIDEAFFEEHNLLLDDIDKAKIDIASLKKVVNAFVADEDGSSFYISDRQGNVIMFVGKNGISTKILNLCDNDGNLNVRLSSDGDDIKICDPMGNYSFLLKNDGTFDVAKIGEKLAAIIEKHGGKTDMTDILSLNPDVEFGNKIAQFARAARTRNEVQWSPLVLCHFSDIHYDIENLSRIIKFCKKYDDKIDDILCGGDAVNYYWSAQNNSFAEWLNVEGSNKIMITLGNHDCWGTNYGETIDKGTVYQRIYEPQINQWGVVQPDNARAKSLMYYYKDYDDKHIRLVSLDCMYFDDEQYMWLIDVLEDARVKGLSVVASSHYPASNVSVFDCSFNTRQVQAGRVSAVLNWKASNAVDDFLDNGGEFVCWLCGHTHLDYVGTVEGHPKQVMVVIDTANYNVSAQHAYSDIARVKDSKSQDLFNIVAFDTYNKTIKVMRVGADYDCWGRKRDTMCIQYKSNPLYTIEKPELIYCS